MTPGPAAPAQRRTTVLLKDGRTATVRPATPADAQAWVANVDAIGAERVLLMSERSSRSPSELAAVFREADPTLELWLVAEVDGVVVGGSDFHRGGHEKNAHTGQLGIALRSECRGLGLGEAVLREGIAWARSVGITKLKLGVFATNERALRLYRKLGFVEEGRLRGEVLLDGRPTDEVLMALWL